jgi:hypothetical protein
MYNKTIVENNKNLYLVLNVKKTLKKYNYFCKYNLECLFELFKKRYNMEPYISSEDIKDNFIEFKVRKIYLQRRFTQDTYDFSDMIKECLHEMLLTNLQIEPSVLNEISLSAMFNVEKINCTTFMVDFS